MGAKASVALVEEITQAKSDENYDRYWELLTEDAVFRMAGIPPALGGVIKGRDAIVEEFRRTTGLSKWKTTIMFGDDTNVCVVGVTTVERFKGGGFVRDSEHGYVTDECVVYKVRDGQVCEITAFINFLSAFIQAGLLDPSALIQ